MLDTFNVCYPKVRDFIAVIESVKCMTHEDTSQYSLGKYKNIMAVLAIVP